MKNNFCDSLFHYLRHFLRKYSRGSIRGSQWNTFLGSRIYNHRSLRTEGSWDCRQHHRSSSPCFQQQWLLHFPVTSLQRAFQAIVSDDLGIFHGWLVWDSGSSRVFKINMEEAKPSAVPIIPLKVIQKWPRTVYLKVDFINMDSWNVFLKEPLAFLGKCWVQISLKNTGHLFLLLCWAGHLSRDRHNSSLSF